MTIVNEVERIIAELPPEKASTLKYWLNEFKAAYRYKKLKPYTVAFKALADFQKGKSNALWN
jgi:hypothetical protein